MKPPQKVSFEDEKKNAATIEAKPQIKNPLGDVTRFMPTALRIKRQDTKNAPKTQHREEQPSAVNRKPAVAAQNKDDAYDLFMQEMQGLL